jgi:hypothetical protein
MNFRSTSTGTGVVGYWGMTNDQIGPNETHESLVNTADIRLCLLSTCSACSAVRQEITKSFLLRAYVRRSKNGRFRHFLGRMRTPSLKFLAVSHVLPGRKYGHLAVI